MSVKGEERTILVHEDCGGGPGARLTIEELRMINSVLNLVARGFERLAKKREHAKRKSDILAEAARVDDLNARLARLP